MASFYTIRRRRLLSLLSAGGLFFTALHAQAQSAIRVLGQSTFTTSSSGTTASSLNGPIEAAYDASGNLFISDYYNNRVMIYRNAAGKANGAAADYVLGQVNFTTATSGSGTNRFASPFGLVIDASGTLYISDQLNNRILIYKNITTRINNSTLTNGAAADFVIGQTALTANTSGTSTTKLYQPAGLAMDVSGNLYVSDLENNRVLVFNGVKAAIDNSTFTNGRAANKVIGQANFTSGDINRGLPVPDASVMYLQRGITVSDAGDLYVADLGNNRILIFRNIASKANGAAADVILGQQDANSDGSGSSLGELDQPMSVKVLGADGPLHVADIANNRVLVFDNPGTRTTGTPANRQIAGGGATSASTLNIPYGLAFRPGTGLWVTDLLNNRVVMFTSAVALPVKLVSFAATANNKANVLNWEFATGSTYDEVTIQRSADGRAFADMHTILPGKEQYAFSDAAPLQGANYYRLKIMSDNGQVTYSTIAVVKRNGSQAGSITVAPIPAQDQITISNSDITLNNSAATITNMQGVVVARFQINGSNVVPMGNWPAGVYLLHIEGNEAIRIVKQ